VPDHLTPAGRSRVMSAIRSSNTKPELALRAALRQRGLAGYRLHVRDLPGMPDVAYTRWRVAVFVDGAFWHGHPDHFNPETANDYWRTKIARTQARDEAATRTLEAAGWQVLRAWDLEVRTAIDEVCERIEQALHAAGHPTAVPPQSHGASGAA